MRNVDSRNGGATVAVSCPDGHSDRVSREVLSDFELVLLATAGHDLRQPLQILQGAHERLGHGPRTTSEQRLLAMGQVAIDQLKRQLDQLVGWVRLRERTRHMQFRPVDLGALLREAERESDLLAAQKGIALRFVPTGSMVTSDALLLGGILRNLISNAIKYTRPGGRVLVGCRHVGENIRLDVIDTGIGMSNDQLSGIFEAFTRLDSIETDGLGMGLFIVRRATGILGHCIEVSSVPSRGTRFSIMAARA